MLLEACNRGLQLAFRREFATCAAKQKHALYAPFCIQDELPQQPQPIVKRCSLNLSIGFHKGTFIRCACRP